MTLWLVKLKESFMRDIGNMCRQIRQTVLLIIISMNVIVQIVSFEFWLESIKRCTNTLFLIRTNKFHLRLAVLKFLLFLTLKCSLYALFWGDSSREYLTNIFQYYPMTIQNWLSCFLERMKLLLNWANKIFHDVNEYRHSKQLQELLRNGFSSRSK